MRVRKTLLIIYLATGLSSGLLNGCNLSNKSSVKTSPAEEVTVSPSPTGTLSAGEINPQEVKTATTNIDLVQTAIDDLKTFTKGITVESDGKVNTTIDYAEAKKRVTDLAQAYHTFKKSLSPQIQQQINSSEDIKNKEIEQLLLNPNSTERKILENLAIGQHKQAQIELQKLTLYTEAVDSKGPGKDGPNQRTAVRKLLVDKILTPTQSNITSLNTAISKLPVSSQAVTPTPVASQKTSDTNTETDATKKVPIDYSWIWPLINTIALLATAGSLFLLWDKISGVVLVHKTQKRRKQETDIEKFKNEVVAIKTNLQEMRNDLTKYLKNNESGGEITQILHQIDEVKNDLERVYHDVILQHSDSLDPTQDLIKSRVDKVLALINSQLTESSHRISSTDPDNLSDQRLNDLDTKLDETYKLVQPISQQQKLFSSTIIESKEILNKIWHQIQQTPSDAKSDRYRFTDKIEELTTERNRLQQQLENKSKQIEQFNSGDTEQLRQQNRKLDQDYNSLRDNHHKLEQQLKEVQQETRNLQDNNANLRQQLSQLQQDKTQVETDRDRYQAESERYKKAATKQAPEVANIPSQWQNLVNAYHQNPDGIFNVNYVQKQGEVVEDEEKGLERRRNSSNPVILTSNNSPEGFYIVTVGNDYLLFPKRHAIAESQKFTASALFEGYKSGNTSKFTLISPAQVTPNSNGVWQLKHKGRLEYS